MYIYPSAREWFTKPTLQVTNNNEARRNRRRGRGSCWPRGWWDCPDPSGGTGGIEGSSVKISESSMRVRKTRWRVWWVYGGLQMDDFVGGERGGGRLGRHRWNRLGSGTSIWLVFSRFCSKKCIHLFDHQIRPINSPSESSTGRRAKLNRNRGDQKQHYLGLFCALQPFERWCRFRFSKLLFSIQQ